MLWISSFPSTFAFLLLILTQVHSNPLPQEATDSFSDADIQHMLPAYGGDFSNDTPFDRAQCFSSRSSTLTAVNRFDCYQVLFNILVLPATPLPRPYSPRTASFPQYYIWNTCAVSVYPMSRTSYDVFSPLGIARIAALIIRDCVTQPRDYLGGRSTIGQRNTFWVAVSKPPLQNQTLETETM